MRKQIIIFGICENSYAHKLKTVVTVLFSS